MHLSFITAIDSWLISLIIFLSMLGSLYTGFRIGKTSEIHESSESSKAVTSAMLGLLAFLLAFTFGMSGSRFDARRELVVNEANAIGTAILRCDLYPAADRREMRAEFQKYLEARIDYYNFGRDLTRVLESVDRASVHGMNIWQKATELSRDPSLSVASIQMIPAINAMLDLKTKRKISELSQVPLSILLMLFVLCIATAFFIGYGSKKGIDKLLVISFCLLTSIVIYITLDLDRPRRGFIQLSTPQSAIIELRELLKEQ
jgi:hypothetical protein